MDNYEPTDMVKYNYQSSDEMWQKLQQVYTQHLNSNPICEICQVAKSVRITPLGKIRAACMECIDNLRIQMKESYIINDV